MSKVLFPTATSIAEQVRSGKKSAVEFTIEAIRLARTIGVDLNAFITICEQKALAQAKVVDEVVQGDEGNLLPLCGVPIAIKDNICYSDYPTTCGSAILENFRPPYDATAVTRLIDSGAVIIGKTNMDEFAMGSSNETSHFGPVRNPVGAKLVPGGSSGGSAAVVAAGVVPIAFGSETGGSVRQPASFCGLLGLKPTYGGISRYGLVAFGSSLDQIGPFANNADDIALAYQVVSGRDGNDSTSLVHTEDDYSSNLESSKKLKIGIPKEYFGDGLDSEINEKIASVIAKLKEDGHTLEEISLPMTDKTIATYYITACAEASSNLARYDGVKYGHRAKEETELMDMYMATRAEGFGTEVKRRIMLGTHVLSSGYYDAYYTKAAKVRQLIRDEFESVFEKYDLLLTPTTPTAAFEFGDKLEDPLAMYLSDVYVASANLAGIPAISIPIEKLADKRPAAIQFIAGKLGEKSLFQIAKRLETLIR